MVGRFRLRKHSAYQSACDTLIRPDPLSKAGGFRAWDRRSGALIGLSYLTPMGGKAQGICAKRDNRGRWGRSCWGLSLTFQIGAFLAEKMRGRPRRAA